MTPTTAGGPSTYQGASYPSVAQPGVAVPVARSLEGLWRNSITRVGGRVFSFPVFLGALLVAGAFLTVRLNLHDALSLPAGQSTFSVIEGDTWLHLTMGKQILDTHTWPTKDTYSFTAAGNENVAYEWLGEVVMAEAYQLGGLQGLTALLLAGAGTLLLLIYIYAFGYTGNVRAAFVASAVALPVIAASHLRPQIFGYALMVLVLIALERFRQGRRRMLWFLPLVFLVWVNTHATFVFGLLALGVYWASGLRAFRAGGLEAKPWTYTERLQLELVGVLSALALCVTPYGTRLAAAPLDILAHSPLGMARITEYQPISAYGPLLKPFVVLLLLFILAQVLMGPSYRVEQIGLLVFATYLATMHVRFLVLFAIVFVPLLADLLARRLPAHRPARERWVLNGSLMAGLGLGMMMFFPPAHDLDWAVYRSFPVRAADYLRVRPVRGRLLNEYTWGSYLTWTLGPSRKVFIDGRSQLYEPGGVYADYLRMMDLDPDTPSLLRKYYIGACLLPRNAPLATLLESLPEWRRAYADHLSVLFVYASKGQGPGPGFLATGRACPLPRLGAGLNSQALQRLGSKRPRRTS